MQYAHWDGVGWLISLGISGSVQYYHSCDPSEFLMRQQEVSVERRVFTKVLFSALNLDGSDRHDAADTSENHEGHGGRQ